MVQQDFNRDWTVCKEGETAGTQVNLPHDAMLYEERSKESPTAGAGAYFYGGKYTYTKRWEVPADWEGCAVVMECEGVYQNAAVFVNGTQAAQRPYGYTNFFVTLDGLLEYGKENEIRVVADNSQTPNTRWYSGSGMYREAQLYVGPRVHILPEGLKITIADEKTVRTEVAIGGLESGFDSGATVKTAIYDGEECVASGEGVIQTLTIPDAKLWDAEHPHLYRCVAELWMDGERCDEASEMFGIRTISWSGQGFFINGQPTLLRGACIHHDNGILGACDFRDAEERRIRILKEAGFNAIRSSHNPVSKAMLRACDKLGMYVMDETFDMWFIQKNPYDYGGDTFRTWWKADVEAMVSKDYNHPSVVMYSTGNEISDLGLAEGQQMNDEMAKFIRSLDAARPVTAGINLMLATRTAKGKGIYGKKEDGSDKHTGSQSMDSMPTSAAFNMMMNRMGGIIDKMASGADADKVADILAPQLDISGYNYATSRYQKEFGKHPERVIVGSETLPKSLYKNWQLVKSLPNLIGDFMWTGWDYLGESGIGTIRYTDKKTKKDVDDGLIISGGAGIVDICGKMRPEVGWGRIIWGLQDHPTIGVDPVIHARHFASASMWRDTGAVESWSWEGYEGEKSDVIVYGEGATAELFVNGKSVGKKKLKECKAKFRKITYEPGTIEAVIYDASGREISRSALQSAAGSTRIRLTPEKTRLSANGQDLCFLNIDLVGENGVTKSSVDRKLTVTVEGSAALQAFGSARPNMAEDFISDTHTTFYGKALAVVRAGYEAGEVRVTVSSEGLASQTVAITVEAYTP